ncbi:glycosyltransferase [Actinocorallia herbida]|uniref:glycosyltransferase n=1 Tax=Actinocorallia herbida TaxID=58109 RepID=UPI001B86FB05|nr:hypothetical protein [Actinocorallia herbida]
MNLALWIVAGLLADAYLLGGGYKVITSKEKIAAAGTPPVYVGFGSMPIRDPEDVARIASEAIRAQDRRAVVSRGWADLALIDDQGDCFVACEADHQALFRRAAAVVHRPPDHRPVNRTGRARPARRAVGPEALLWWVRRS